MGCDSLHNCNEASTPLQPLPSRLQLNSPINQSMERAKENNVKYLLGKQSELAKEEHVVQQLKSDVQFKKIGISTSEIPNKCQSGIASSFQEHQTILEILVHPDKDRRHLNKQPLQYPYNCIGILCFSVKQGTYTATGFLVSPNTVLTAAHFLEDYSCFGKQPMQFILKQQESQADFGLVLNSNKVVKYRYPTDYSKAISPIQNDFGMVLLERQVQMQTYLPLGVNYNCKHKAQVFGFPTFLPNLEYKMIGMKGAIIQVTDDYLTYDIDTTLGESGSPVLLELIQNVVVAVGIHAGGAYFSCLNQGKITKRPSHPPNELNVTKDKYNSACKFNSSNIQQLKLYAKQMKAKHFQIIDFGQSNQLAANKWEVKLLAQEQVSLMVKEVQLNQGTPNQLIKNCKRLSKYYYERERFNISLPYCEKGLRLAGTDIMNQAQLYNLMGLNYQELKQFQTAEMCYNRSLAIFEHRTDEYPQSYAQVCNNLGTLLLCLQEQTKALAYFEAAERILREKNLKDNEKYIATLTNIGLIKRKSISAPQKMDQYQSVRKFKSALEIDQHISTREGRAIIYYNLSQCFFEAQKFDDWLRYSAGSLAILRLFGVQNHSTCKIWKYQLLQKIDLFLTKQLTYNLVWKLIYFIHDYLKPRDQKSGRKPNSQYNPEEYSWQYDSISTSSQSQILKIMTYYEKEEAIQFKLSQAFQLLFQGSNNHTY